MATMTFDFPQSLTEKYRPRLISDFVGIHKAKRICQSLAATPREINLLFVGASGMGKTTLAMALAESIPAELHHIPSQNCNLETITRIRQTCQYVPISGFKMHLILIDEADCMSGAAKIAFLSMLDSTNRPPNTIIIFTCNSTDRLNENDETKGRFLSRCLQVEFSNYGVSSETIELLKRVWNQEAPQGAKAPDFARIVKNACNNVRAALMSLESELLCA